MTILNTKQYIYGLNKEGKRVASQADIIAADSTGKVYVIDVRSGYKSIRSRYDVLLNAYTKFTIKDQVTGTLKQIEDIINTKFNVPVKGLYCLPVIYNSRSEDGIKVDRDENGKMLISVKAGMDVSYSEDITQIKKDVSDLVDHVNTLINQYNELVKESKKYISDYQEIPNIELKEYSTVSEYTTYAQKIHAQFDDLQSRINTIHQTIQNSISAENNVWIENAEQFIQGEPSTETTVLAQNLSIACKELDAVLSKIPPLKPTAHIEKENVKKLYQVIFDAQKALDELLQDPNASMIDVRAEEELIASAMEFLAENKQNFGAMSIFVQKWWADNFVVGKSGNTEKGVSSIFDQSVMFVNTINSWIETL